MLKTDVFPAPLGPMIPRHSDISTERVNLSATTMEPKLREIPSA
jgi:hypothetical protein